MPLPPILLLLGATPGPPAASADIPGGGGDLAGAIGYGRVIAQGFQSYQPVSFARSRDNKLVMVNGLTRGRIWDGVQGAAELLGLDAPTSQPSVSLTPSVGNAQAGTYLFAYRYVDPRGVPTSLSPARSRTASANDQFNWSVPRPTIGRIKTIELWRTPAGVTDPFYKAFTITVGGQIYASSNSSGQTKVAFTAAHGLVGGESIRFSGHSRLALNETNWTVVSVPDSLSVVISAAHSGSSSDNGFGGTWTRVGGSVTQTDVLPDPTLQLREALPINSGSNAGTAARELGARRFEPPVSNKAVVVYFQDRYWFAVDPIYDEGTVQVAHGSAVVTGTGTNFDQAMVGRQFFLKNPSTAFREPLTVGAVSSATSLTLSTPLLGSTGSGLKYAIANPPELNDLLYFCVDEATEILTQRGWLKHHEIEPDDLALSIDPATEQIEWSPVESVHRFPFAGYMNRWKSTRFDALTTDDHRWLARGCGMVGGHWTLRDGGEARTHFTTTKAAQEMTAKRLVAGGGTPVAPLLASHFEDQFVELVGWYVTEGSRYRYGQSISIAQSESANADKCRKIQSLVRHFSARGATATACAANDNGWGEIRQFYFGKGIGGVVQDAAPDKQLTPEFLLSLDQRQLQLLFDTLIDADGHRTVSAGTEIFAQKDPGRCDGFQMLAAMLGRRTGSHACFNKKYRETYYNVTAYRSPHVTVCRLGRSREWYEGVVWCPKTKHGTWMARRNGFTYWTGNTYIDEPESLPAAQNNVVMQNNTGDADRLTGLMPAGSALFLLRERHIYRMTYHRQPQIDADITLAVARGCLNQRCWDNFEGLSYLLDQSGAYAFNGSSVEPISGPIQNYIREGLIDLSAAKYFHVKVDPRIESVRFWVKFVGDTGTRPKRCFCYSVRTGFWWYESYATEIGASAQFNVDGVLRSVFGMGVGRDEFFSHAIGVSDGVSTAIRGTVASATASTLVDSAAPFTTTNPPPGASVVLLSGAGKGQVRRVASFGGDTTTLNVAPDWTVNPAAGDLYCVGGIPWRLRTKIFTYAGTLPEKPNDSLGNPRGLHVSYRPTSNAHSLELARYLNHDASAVLGELDVNVGDPWTARAGDRFISLDMKSVRIEDIAQPGHAWLRTFDAQESTAQAPKYVTLELSGVQIDNQIEIFDVLVEGAD